MTSPHLPSAHEIHDTELELPVPKVVSTAPTLVRALAALIDFVPPFLIATLATWLLVTSDPVPLDPKEWNLIDQVVDYLHDRPGRSSLAFLTFVVLQILWPLVFMARTPGRRLLGLELISRAPSLTFPRLLAWSALRVVLLLPAGLGALWAIIDPDRRTLYDRIAGLWLTRPPRPAPSADPASA